MRVSWEVTAEDVAKIRAFLVSREDDPLVRSRVARNLAPSKPEMARSTVWYRIIACLLSTQQRSGPTSATTRFLRQRPFPFGYDVVVAAPDARGLVRDVLAGFGGIRRLNRVADEVDDNLSILEGGLWSHLLATMDGLRSGPTTPQRERVAAEWIDRHLAGFGPKQSRNLLQSLGLTRYEVPIDSRTVGWLERVGFPVPLSAKALADAGYYAFVSEGIQRLCAACEVYPCVLDAAIFTDADGGNWTEADLVW